MARVTYTVTNIVQNRSRDDAASWHVLIAFSPTLRDAAGSLTLRLGDIWLNLADARGGDRQFTWSDVALDWRIGSTVRVSLHEFPEAFEARSIDGWGNNRIDPELGTAHSRLLRVASVSPVYGLTGAPPSGLPEPRTISNILAAQSEPVPSARGLTDMVLAVGPVPGPRPEPHPGGTSSGAASARHSPE